MNTAVRSAGTGLSSCVPSRSAMTPSVKSVGERSSGSIRESALSARPRAAVPAIVPAAQVAAAGRSSVPTFLGELPLPDQ